MGKRKLNIFSWVLSVFVVWYSWLNLSAYIIKIFESVSDISPKLLLFYCAKSMYYWRIEEGMNGVFVLYFKMLGYHYLLSVNMCGLIYDRLGVD